MSYLAAIEVDQRQRIVNSSDALKEMLGGSWTIEATQTEAKGILDRHKTVEPIKLASGDIWLRCGDLMELAACLAEFRSRIVDHLNLPCSFAVVAEKKDDAYASRRELMARVKRIKQGKDGETGFLSLPWLAPCQIQPDQYANLWYPDRSKKKIHTRRELESADSDARTQAGWKTVSSYYKTFDGSSEIRLRSPRSMEDFAADGEGKYIALLRFDADNAGTFFERLDLSPRKEDEVKAGPWEILRDCSEAFTQTLRGSFRQALHKTLETGRQQGALPADSFFPISPLIHAGDDLLIVVRKDLAMDFACHLMRIHREMASENEILKQHKNEETKAITLSGSIVFARSGFPFSVLSSISEHLERSAKLTRKSPRNVNDEPCLDIYWLESTGRENPIEQRRLALSYQVSGANEAYSLSTLPWTLSQAEAMNNCAQQIERQGIARGKWHQLLAGLRAGEPAGSLVYQRWLQHLDKAEQECMGKVLAELEACGLWSFETEPWFDCTPNDSAEFKYWASPLLELHELREMLAGKHAKRQEETEP